MPLKTDPLFDRADAALTESKRLRDEAASLLRETNVALRQRHAAGISEAEWLALRAWRYRR